MVLVKYNLYKWEITGNELSVSKKFFPAALSGGAVL